MYAHWWKKERLPPEVVRGIALAYNKSLPSKDSKDSGSVCSSCFCSLGASDYSEGALYCSVCQNCADYYNGSATSTTNTTTTTARTRSSVGTTRAGGGPPGAANGAGGASSDGGVGGGGGSGAGGKYLSKQNKHNLDNDKLNNNNNNNHQPSQQQLEKPPTEHHNHNQLQPPNNKHVLHSEKKSQFTLNLKQRFCSIFRFRRSNHSRCRGSGGGQTGTLANANAGATAPLIPPAAVITSAPGAAGQPQLATELNGGGAGGASITAEADEPNADLRKKFQSRALPPLPKKGECSAPPLPVKQSLKAIYTSLCPP